MPGTSRNLLFLLGFVVFLTASANNHTNGSLIDTLESAFAAFFDPQLLLPRIPRLSANFFQTLTEERAAFHDLALKLNATTPDNETLAVTERFHQLLLPTFTHLYPNVSMESLDNDTSEPFYISLMLNFFSNETETRTLATTQLKTMCTGANTSMTHYADLDLANNTCTGALITFEIFQTDRMTNSVVRIKDPRLPRLNQPSDKCVNQFYQLQDYYESFSKNITKVQDITEEAKRKLWSNPKFNASDLCTRISMLHHYLDTIQAFKNFTSQPPCEGHRDLQAADYGDLRARASQKVNHNGVGLLSAMFCDEATGKFDGKTGEMFEYVKKTFAQSNQNYFSVLSAGLQYT